MFESHVKLMVLPMGFVWHDSSIIALFFYRVWFFSSYPSVFFIV